MYKFLKQILSILLIILLINFRGFSIYININIYNILFLFDKNGKLAFKKNKKSVYVIKLVMLI